MRKTGPAGQRVKYFVHCLAQSPRPATCCTDIQADLVYSHNGYDVTSYFRSAFIEVRKTVENAASDGFWVEF